MTALSVPTLPALKCDYCERTFKTLAALTSHERHIHPDEGGCPLCEGGNGSACSWHWL